MVATEPNDLAVQDPPTGGQDDCHKRVVRTVERRSVWEDRVRLFYELRFTGIRRQNKPWQGAADLFYPMADGIIDKTKPFYLAQLYATETLATFVSLKTQADGLNSAAERYYDFQVKQRSNFEEEIIYCIDQMCHQGRGVLKITWDEGRARLRFDAPLLLDMILPIEASDFEDADWCVHVLRMSEAAYRRNPRYKQDDAFIKSLRGTANDTTQRRAGFEASKANREGLTPNTGEDDEILLWERYERTTEKTGELDAAGDPILRTKIMIRTYSPKNPDAGDARQEFEMPYEHKQLPFASAAYELTSKGWHTPRGQVELVAADQAYMVRLWNTKSDFLTLTTMPVFGTNKEIPNNVNITMEPGKVLPYQAQAVQFPSPPMSLDQEMANVRAIAEYRVGLPDFGLAGRRGSIDGSGGGKPTATEIERISDVMNQSQDIRTRLFRLFSGKVHRQAWALLVQYDKGQGQYMTEAGMQMMNPAALHLEYEITPSGSADSWNKGGRMQRAIARLQLLGNSPFINQAELIKSYLEDDDIQLVPRLFQDPQSKAADAKEEQALEIAIMQEGFPAEVHQYDDDIAHLQGLLEYGGRVLSRGQPPDPEVTVLLLAHTAAHTQQAVEKGLKDQLAPLMPPLQDLEAALTAILKRVVLARVQPPPSAPMTPSSVAGNGGLAPAAVPVGGARGMAGGTPNGNGRAALLSAIRPAGGPQ